MKRNVFFGGLLFVLVMVLAGCGNTKEVAYFQDVRDGLDLAETVSKELVLREGDKLTIVVNSSDSRLANLFNLPVMSQRVGYAGSGNSSYQMSLYTVDKEGMIEFPIIGKIKVVGLNRTQVAEKVKNEIVKSEQLKDPVVTVEFANMFVTLLGEVNKQGRYEIVNDRLTVIDAIGMAGDLTIQGKRTNVSVIRSENGVRHVYTLDLTNAENVVKSPAFYLQQDDIVYVEPNDVRKRQTTVNGNNVLSTSFWISVASLLTSIAVLIKN